MQHGLVVGRVLVGPLDGLGDLRCQRGGGGESGKTAEGHHQWRGPASTESWGVHHRVVVDHFHGGGLADHLDERLSGGRMVQQQVWDYYYYYH